MNILRKKQVRITRKDNESKEKKKREENKLNCPKVEMNNQSEKFVFGMINEFYIARILYPLHSKYLMRVQTISFFIGRLRLHWVYHMPKDRKKKKKNGLSKAKFAVLCNLGLKLSFLIQIF